MKRSLLISLTIALCSNVFCQTISFDQQTVFDQNFQTSPAANDDGLIFDYEGDGDQDYLVHFGSDGDQLKVFINDGSQFSTSVIFYDQFEDRYLNFKGDYDNDGDIDIAVSGRISGVSGLFIFENEGSGTFADPVLAITNVSAQGDYDLDGLIDFFYFTSDPSGDDIYWLRNLGSLQFADAEILVTDLDPLINSNNPTVDRIVSIELLDANGDGTADFYTKALNGIQYISNNNDDGSFTTTAISTGYNFYNSAFSSLVDIDGDDDMDFLSGNTSLGGGAVGQLVAVSFNDGSNNFSTNQTITNFDGGAGPVPGFIKGIDYDNDDDMDIFVGQAGGDPVMGSGVIFENNGALSFTKKDILTDVLFSSPTDNDAELFMSDFNGDGRLDFLTHTNADSDIILHIQNADGSYSSDQFINQESELIHDLQFIDVDNDGAEDIVSYDLTNGKIMVSYFNSSSNEYDKFEVLTDNFAYGIGGYSTSSPAASLMRLAYWDNDANIDLIYVFTQVGGGATATDQVNLVEDFLGARDTINLHTPSSSFASVHSIKLADIDNDNDLDAFLSIAGSRNDLWLENTGSSTVIEHFTGVIAGASYEFGDLNGDDFLDLVSIEALTGGTNARTTFSIYNPTTKQFEFSQDLSTGLYDVTFTFGDPDNDGDQDIIYARGSWYENTDGLGTMASGANLLDNGVGSIPKVGDFNNDGLDDVVYLGANSLGDGKFGVYLNNGDETYTTESFNGPGGIAPFQLVDLDNNGILDIIASGTINSSLSQPLWYKTCFNTSSTINATACDSYTAPSGAIFTSSGIYEDLIANSIGCDSLITIDLTINPTFNETASASICEGETYEFGTQTLDMTGEYTEIFQSQNNCDSTVVLTLTVNAVYNESVSAEICDGETFEFGTQTLIESGDYTELFESSLGCDSTVNLSLVVNPIYNESFSAEICDGETYEWEELSLKEAGDFTQVFESSLGCDSTVVLSLTLHPTFNESISVEICDGETYEFGSLTLMEPGEYTELFQSGDGCDSTVVLSLSVSETYSVQASQTICAGEEITFGDQTITESGSFTSTFQSSAGCDSLVTLAVDISPTFEETFAATICNNERFEFGTQTLTASGEYTELFSSSSGCDSTVVLTLTVNTTIEEDTEVAICAGETYTFGNQSLTTGGTYSEIFTSSLGCDSTVNLTLNLLNSHEESAEIAICNGESYDFGGTLLTEAGVYSNNFQTSEGCDSLVNLTLNVNTVYQVDSQLTICENETFVFGDQVLNQSGAYEFTFGSSLGCDSTVNLSLTVNPSIESTIDLSICDGETFSFGSQTLSEGGTYSELFSSTNQCDSLVNLNLTVINLDASVQNSNGTLTTNQMEGTFQWINCDNGNSLIDGATSRTFSPDFGGNYAVMISNEGCDVTSECISFSMETPLNVTGSQEIAFYPVPTDGELIVELKDRTFSGEVRISNLAGQIVYQKRFINESKLMNHFHLASGTYILHLIDHSQQVLRTKRVLIKDN